MLLCSQATRQLSKMEVSCTLMVHPLTVATVLKHFLLNIAVDFTLLPSFLKLFDLLSSVRLPIAL